MAAALDEMLQPTPGAQSVENFVEGAGPNTVNAIVVMYPNVVLNRKRTKAPS